VDELEFIENKNSWGCYLQGGVRGIRELDFERIVGPTSVAQAHMSIMEVESKAEFALENHLEDFLDRNWNSVDFGCSLERYVSGEQDGRQFSAGSWNIDFLCLDRISGDLVILELKKGKTSDATVGQILRYMGWVRQNIAKPNQKVRGVIIAKEMDEAMRYAVDNQQDIKILQYRVDFSLSPPPQ
jgi:restriction system protein